MVAAADAAFRKTRGRCDETVSKRLRFAEMRRHASVTGVPTCAADAAQAEAADLRGLLLPQEPALRPRRSNEPCTTFRPNRPEGLVPPRQPVLLMRPPRWATQPLTRVGRQAGPPPLRAQLAAPGGYVLRHARARSVRELRPDAAEMDRCWAALGPHHLRQPPQHGLLAQRRRLLLRRPAAGGRQGRPRRGRPRRGRDRGQRAGSWRSSASGRCRRPRAGSTSRSRFPRARSAASSSSRSTSTPTAPRRPTRTASCGSTCRCATPPRPPAGVPIRARRALMEGTPVLEVVESPLDAEDAIRANEPLPDALPVLPLRETVTFPETLTPLAVGQERSIKLVDDVLGANRMLAMVAARDPENEEPGPDGPLRRRRRRRRRPHAQGPRRDDPHPRPGDPAGAARPLRRRGALPRRADRRAARRGRATAPSWRR